MLRAAGLFVATSACVFWTYGWWWAGGDPFADASVARDAAAFSTALMSILLAHELGHYLVGRRHGLEMSPPYFIPFPAAFGTFGAIIRMRSLPRDRAALLEMGAAGPIAGLVVAAIFMAIGLPGTTAGVTSVPPPADPVELPALLETIFGGLDAILSWGPLGWLSARLSPPVPEGHAPVMIFNNPPLMDLLGEVLLGAPPGRFDELRPTALAGWVGCLLTAINLIPIGQLDGGHVVNALAPRRAQGIAKVLLGVALIGGIAWSGWAFWAFLLVAMGAWRSLPVPVEPPPTPRARAVAVAALIAFGLSFMPRPVELDSLPYEGSGLEGADGAAPSGGDGI